MVQLRAAGTTIEEMKMYFLREKVKGWRQRQDWYENDRTAFSFGLVQIEASNSRIMYLKLKAMFIVAVSVARSIQKSFPKVGLAHQEVVSKLARASPTGCSRCPSLVSQPDVCCLTRCTRTHAAPLHRVICFSLHCIHYFLHSPYVCLQQISATRRSSLLTRDGLRQCSEKAQVHPRRTEITAVNFA